MARPLQTPCSSRSTEMARTSQLIVTVCHLPRLELPSWSSCLTCDKRSSRYTSYSRITTFLAPPWFASQMDMHMSLSLAWSALKTICLRQKFPAVLRGSWRDGTRHFPLLRCKVHRRSLTMNQEYGRRPRNGSMLSPSIPDSQRPKLRPCMKGFSILPISCCPMTICWNPWYACSMLLTFCPTDSSINQVLGHGDLLCANIIVQSSADGIGAPDVAAVRFIDYE